MSCLERPGCSLAGSTELRAHRCRVGFPSDRYRRDVLVLPVSRICASSLLFSEFVRCVVVVFVCVCCLRLPSVHLTHQLAGIWLRCHKSLQKSKHMHSSTAARNGGNRKNFIIFSRRRHRSTSFSSTHNKSCLCSQRNDHLSLLSGCVMH